jgi:hypothetical protein
MPNKTDTPQMERRYTPQVVAVESRADDQPSQIAGYAAVYYDGTPETEFVLWEGAVERIMPGAFDRAIREDDVRGLFNHDPNQVLGRTAANTLTLSSDATGLRYVDDVPDTGVGRDVSASIERGDVTGSSFSFTITDVEWRVEDEIEIREIRGVRVYDVGPVTFAAYEATSAGIRALQVLDVTHMGTVGRAYTLGEDPLDGVRSERAELLKADWAGAESDRRELARIARRNRARIVELGLTRP